ncbi:archease [Chloroflexota bacterium]
MEKEFEILNHTADVGIIAYGDDTKEAFANAAKGLFSLITELDNVEESEHRDIELTAPDQESLLVEWLNELVYLFDAENMLFKKFDITQFSNTHLKARSYGHKVDSSKHKLKMGIKAATYHMLKIDKSNGSKVQVLFDI